MNFNLLDKEFIPVIWSDRHQRFVKSQEQGGHHV